MRIQLKTPVQEYPTGAIVDWLKRDAEFLIARGEATAVSEGDQLHSAVQGEVMRQLAHGIASEAAKPFRQRAKGLGEFLRGVTRKDAGQHLAPFYSDGIVRKAALSSGSGSTGGWTLPVAFARQILSGGEAGHIRQRARLIPSSSVSCDIPILSATGASVVGASPFLGGLQLSWFTENATPSETEPNFKMRQALLGWLGGFVTVSNVWLADSSDLQIESFLTALFADALNWYEEYAFLWGNGVSQPLGIVNCPCTLTVNRQTANKIQFQDVAAMESKLLPQSVNGAFYLYSPTALAQLLQLQDGANRAVMLQAGLSSNGKPQMTLMGRPAYCTEKLQPLGTKGDLMLIDAQHYVITDHVSEEDQAQGHGRSLAVSWSGEANMTIWTKNQSVYLLAERLDAGPWLDGPVTLQDGSTQVSPFIVLV